MGSWVSGWCRALREGVEIACGAFACGGEEPLEGHGPCQPRRGPPRLTHVARDLSWGEVERVEAVRPRAQASCC